MKTQLKSILLAALFLLGFAASSQAQTALNTTTLSSAVNGPAMYNGTVLTTAGIDQVVFLASVAGISAPSLPGSPVSFIYVGREAMGVFTVNTTLKSVGVKRGDLGTQASPHPSGDMVIISNVYTTTQAFGANPLPSGFFPNDPPYNGTCTAAGTPTTPWLNILTGAQWVCSAQTNTWAPSWSNPLANPGTWIQTGTVASVAGATLPSGPYFNISGTNAITSFTIPVGFNVNTGGCFTVKPTGIFTWTAAGNIQTAGTVTATTTPVTFCWDVAAQKWVPSRLS